MTQQNKKNREASSPTILNDYASSDRVEYSKCVCLRVDVPYRTTLLYYLITIVVFQSELNMGTACSLFKLIIIDIESILKINLHTFCSYLILISNNMGVSFIMF